MDALQALKDTVDCLHTASQFALLTVQYIRASDTMGAKVMASNVGSQLAEAQTCARIHDGQC
jgi:hypothetical protein